MTWSHSSSLHAHEEVVAGDAGVVDQDVDRRGRRLGGRDQRLDRGLVRQVAGHDMGALAEFGGQGIERVAARAGQDHDRALGMQPLRDGAADAAAGARHQGGLSGKVEHLGVL